MERLEELKRIYTDPQNPASFSGVEPLLKEAKKIDPTIKRKDVEAFLRDNETYTLHRRSLNRFKRLKIRSSGLYWSWQIDLLEIPLAKANDGYRFVFNAVDIYSRQLFSVPLKTKSGPEVRAAFEKVFTEDRLANYIACDQGKEFWNKHVLEFVNKNNIHMYSPSSQEMKASLAERYNQLLAQKLQRIMHHNNSLRWIDYLDDAVSSLNHRVCRTIGMRPVDVQQNTFPYVPPEVVKCKFKIGDTVRLSSYKRIFTKLYKGRWSREIFVVSQAIGFEVPHYYVKDTYGEDVRGVFYESELQLVTNNSGVYKINKILQRRTRRGVREVLVSWQDYDQPSWIPEADVVDL